MAVLALCAEGTNQRNNRGAAGDTNMWRVASQVADDICYVSGVGVEQNFAPIRLLTGWGAKTKALKLAGCAREFLASRPYGEQPLIVGVGGSRGCAVLLRACSILDVPIHAVVLLDSVYSFGIPWLRWLDRRSYPHEVPGNIRHALHVVALQEDTPGFSPTIYPEREGLLQVVTPGDHTEVLRGPEAERIALHWLDTLGIPARFKPPEDGWGEPTRHLPGLGSYWPQSVP